MTNRKPALPKDREKAREKALKQWSNPESRAKLQAALTRKTPGPNAVDTVQKACENGCTVAEIAAALGIARSTFQEWREKYPEIEAAYTAGRAIEHDRLVNALFTAATQKGNITAAIFLLKARHGYVEGVPLVQNSVSVNFTLPGAMSPEQYVKTLTVEAQLVRPEEAQRLASDKKVRKVLKNELAREDE